MVLGSGDCLASPNIRRAPMSPCWTEVGTPAVPAGALCSLIASPPIFAVQTDESPSKPCGLVTLPPNLASRSEVGMSLQAFALGPYYGDVWAAREYASTTKAKEVA